MEILQQQRIKKYSKKRSMSPMAMGTKDQAPQAAKIMKP